MKIRKAVLVAAAYSYIRHEHRYQQWPWRICGVANAELDETVRRSIADAFGRSCPKCLDAGFCRPLEYRIQNCQDLVGPRWGAAITKWASLLDVETHEVELMHAFNKRCATHLSKFELLAARCVNSQALKAIDLALPVLPTRPGGVVQDSEAPAKKRRKHVHAGQLTSYKAPIQYFHSVCVQRDRAIGVIGRGRMHACSREYWSAVKAEWSDLSDADRQDYTSIWESLKDAIVTNHIAHDRCSAVQDRDGATTSTDCPVVVAEQQLPDQRALVLDVACDPDVTSRPAFPMSASVFSDVLEHAAAIGSTENTRGSYATRAAELFRSDVCGLAKATGRIAPNLVGDRQCGAVCLQSSHLSCLAVSAKMLRTLTALTKDTKDFFDDLVCVALQVLKGVQLRTRVVGLGAGVVC
jgi:hypothetical protein